MLEVLEHSRGISHSSSRVVSKSNSSSSSTPYTPDQELSVFGKWVGDEVWVPPKDSSATMAKFLLDHYGCLASKETCWQAIIDEHRSQFTQVRQIELKEASIRLPKGRVYVSITQREHFDQISEKIPGCVQTRLDEFLEGPGKKPGVKVYYLKPLCIEFDDKLIFTTQDELQGIIETIQTEVFREYRKRYFLHRPMRHVAHAADLAFAVPRRVWKHIAERKKRAIESYHAKLEFNRRKAVMRAVKCRNKFRSDECTFDDMLSITKTPDRLDVIRQYAIERELSEAETRKLLLASAVTLPWFVTVPLGVYYLTTAVLGATAPVMLCDPAFVAEMPDAKGTLMKIGHFDEVAGVTHVEI